METTYGWPTQKHSYIAADTDGSTTAHVNRRPARTACSAALNRTISPAPVTSW
ncbi:hypothetical protein MYA98_07790 [Salmonella sp. WGH-01]|nr:hypothetical protein MYA98_07790 [Salmonella sp. WGH-01]